MPEFDPNKPFEVVDNKTKEFDPNAPFEVVDVKKKEKVSGTGSENLSTSPQQENQPASQSQSGSGQAQTIDAQIADQREPSKHYNFPVFNELPPIKVGNTTLNSEEDYSNLNIKPNKTKEQLVALRQWAENKNKIKIRQSGITTEQIKSHFKYTEATNKADEHIHKLGGISPNEQIEKFRNGLAKIQTKYPSMADDNAKSEVLSLASNLGLNYDNGNIFIPKQQIDKYNTFIKDEYDNIAQKEKESNEPGYAASVAGSFDQGLIELGTGILKSNDILGAIVMNLPKGKLSTEGAQEGYAYKLGKKADDWAKETFPVAGKYQDDLLVGIARTAPFLASFALGNAAGSIGRISEAEKAIVGADMGLQGIKTGTTLAEQALSQAPPAIVMGLNTGVKGFDAAIAKKNDADNLTLDEYRGKYQVSVDKQKEVDAEYVTLKDRDAGSIGFDAFKGELLAGSVPFMLPINITYLKALQQIDTRTGGAIKDALINGVKNNAINSVDGFVQMGLMTAMSNYTAKNVYDFQKDIFNDVVSSGTSGFTVNFLINGMLGVLTKMKGGFANIKDKEQVQKSIDELEKKKEDTILLKPEEPYTETIETKGGTGNAVQIEKPNEMDIRQRPENGGGMGARDPELEKTARAGEQNNEAQKNAEKEVDIDSLVDKVSSNKEILDKSKNIDEFLEKSNLSVEEKFLVNEAINKKMAEKVPDKELDDLLNTLKKDCPPSMIQAKYGIKTEFKSGSKWEVVEDIEGKSHKEGGEDVEVKGKDVEAEGGEIIIKNQEGTEAIIPKKSKYEVLGMIHDNCHKCLDDFVSKLPKMGEYAGEGGVEGDVTAENAGTNVVEESTNKDKYDITTQHPTYYYEGKQFYPLQNTIDLKGRTDIFKIGEDDSKSPIWGTYVNPNTDSALKYAYDYIAKAALYRNKETGLTHMVFNRSILQNFINQ